MSLPTVRQSPDDKASADPRVGGEGGKAVVSGAVPAAPRDMDPMIGRVLDGRFTIESRLGAGSMGTVYKAKQHAMGRDVAVKILRSDRALDESSRARFLREARANSLLASPHTVTVFDFGQADNGDFFLAMELLEGESLGQRLQRDKRIAPDLAVDAARQALRSLAEAHAKGIIHRDLKPDNLFFAKVARVDEAGQRQHEEIVKVLDFGIAKMLAAENAEMNAVETQAGTVFGTPRYMSPEQAQGKPLDARSDLYSLGVILYHMLTGRPPFTDDDAIVVMARHIKTPPKRPIEACPQANIPPELENVLLRVLAKEPHLRPASAEGLSQELGRAMNLSATATSGVRISLGGSTPPPPMALAPQPAPVFPAPAPVPAPPGADAAIPKAPPVPESLTALPETPGSTDSVQIAAGLAPGRSRRIVVVAIASALVAGAVAAFAMGRHEEPTARPAIDMERAPVTATATTAPSPPSPNDVPQPPPTSSIPSTSFQDLPRAPAPDAPPRSDPRRGAPPPPPRASHPAPRPSATATASGHYGLFE